LLTGRADYRVTVCPVEYSHVQNVCYVIYILMFSVLSQKSEEAAAGHALPQKIAPACLHFLCRVLQVGLSGVKVWNPCDLGMKVG